MIAQWQQAEPTFVNFNASTNNIPIPGRGLLMTYDKCSLEIDRLGSGDLPHCDGQTVRPSCMEAFGHQAQIDSGGGEEEKKESK